MPETYTAVLWVLGCAGKALLWPLAAGTPLVISEEVQHALQTQQPVVALESTIVSHGMPYPQSLQTALEVEAVVRQHGAVPATIAVLHGVPHVGLTAEQLELIAKAGLAVHKTSRRDLPLVMAKRLHGSTTVSATMLLAARAGIPTFVTGGIGGVHRGAESSLDISADLIELGRTQMIVVCAGIKSVLDIPKTLEYLETQGVCVAAVGTDEFPCFFSRNSGCKAPTTIESAAEAAELMRSSQLLAMGSSILIGVPISEQHAAAGAQIEKAIQQALREADRKRIHGAAVTPYLLHRVQELTGGASLTANIHLIKNNAAFGAEVAKALCKYNPA
eukprot:jgi/Astpho2/8129/fgenesh1_pm.00120_%23_22_t